MDIGLFASVLWRRKLVVLVGLVLACAVAALSYARPAIEDGHLTLKYREEEKWQSSSRVLLTLPGFSSGQSLVEADTTAESILRAEDRLAGLALLYAGLATGDEVTRIVRSDGPIRGRVVTEAARVSGGSAVLPIVAITAVAPSRGEAKNLANRYASALRTFVTQRQRANRVDPSSRVSLKFLNRATEAELAEPRKATLPIVVFLAVLSATVGFAIALENRKRRATRTTTLSTDVQTLQQPEQDITALGREPQPESRVASARNR